MAIACLQAWFRSFFLYLMKNTTMLKSLDGKKDAPVGKLNTGSRKIGILLVDDHCMVREMVRIFLEHQPDMLVIGEAGTGLEAVKMADQLHPDVIIMDISLPELNGIEATRRIISRNPQIKVIGLSMFSESKPKKNLIEAGAIDYFQKGSAFSGLVKAIRRAALV
ncbi:MAG: response regulator [Acidobacteriota bacterium]